MSYAWTFPKSLVISGKEYEIRTDFRVILNLLSALNDPELISENENHTAYMKARIILEIMYVDSDDIPQEDWQEAINKAVEFIDMGIGDDSKKPRLMDWEQDSPIIIPAINRVLNYEVREREYLHWWTFLGAYMEIGESLFSHILHIRQKKAKGERLEKWEQKFYSENKSLIDIQSKEKRSSEEKDVLRNYFGYNKK